MILLLKRAQAGAVPSACPGVLLPPLRAKRVVLLRHGQSMWNAEGGIQGSSDVFALTPKWESQPETSRQMLLSDSFDTCFTSLLAHSRCTAEIIWEGRDDDNLIPDSDLCEIDLYSFQVLVEMPECDELVILISMDC